MWIYYMWARQPQQLKITNARQTNIRKRKDDAHRKAYTWKVTLQHCLNFKNGDVTGQKINFLPSIHRIESYNH